MSVIYTATPWAARPVRRTPSRRRRAERGTEALILLMWFAMIVGAAQWAVGMAVQYWWASVPAAVLLAVARGRHLSAAALSARLPRGS